MKKMLMTATISFFVALAVNGQVSISALNTAVTENFDELTETGTTFPTNWTALRLSGSGAAGATLVLSSTSGSTTSGGIYNVGSIGSNERAFGTLASGSTMPAFGVQFQNNTGSTIGSIDFVGVYEQWKSGSNSGVNEVVAFEYSFDATALNNGTWTALTSMNFNEILTSTTAAAAVDGNANKTNLSGSITDLNFTNGSKLWIRWRDTDDAGSDGMHALDDFSLTAHGVAAVSDGNGTAVLDNVTSGSALLNLDIFEKSKSSTSVKITITGVETGNLTSFSVTVPSEWGTISVSDVTLSGSGFSSAATGVSSNVITITSAAVTSTDLGVLTIDNLTSPNPNSASDLGSYIFSVKSAKSGGSLTSINSSPAATVAMPIANIKDQDANGVPLDLNNTVAVEGTATIANGIFTPGDLDSYLEDGSYGVNIYKSGGASIALTVGNKYIVKGTVGQLSGKTRITASDVIEIGTGTLPSIYTVYTISDLIASGEVMEGRLVSIKNVTITGTWPTSSTAYVNLTATDASGNFTLRVNTTTAGVTDLSGQEKDVVAIFEQFDSSSPFDAGYQIFTRSESDFYAAGTLPVELTSFRASKTNSGVTLYWSTKTETNNNGFEIEKSADKSTWTKIGFVALC